VKSRIWIVLLLLALATAFFALGFDATMSLAHIKQRHFDAVHLYGQRPLFVVLGFMALHIAALTLSLPGAVLTMALAGGAIFGIWPGTLIVLTSLTIGDSSGLLVARYLLRDWVRRRFGAQLAVVEAGIEKNGAFYLFGLRMMPLIPYFIVNLTMGLTRMPIRIFAPVSFVALAPATALYVAAGTRLAAIERSSDVLSAELVLTLGAIGALPIVTRLILDRYRSARAASNRS
jgi:uncharacterized membrane protein YdjX (TVP38/TMEM64 family)